MKDLQTLFSVFVLYLIFCICIDSQFAADFLQYAIED